MRRNTGRVVTAMALMVVLALSGGSSFADTNGNDPYPNSNGASTYSEVQLFLDATSYVVNLV
jgi:hypothetical protein